MYLTWFYAGAQKYSYHLLGLLIMTSFLFLKQSTLPSSYKMRFDYEPVPVKLKFDRLTQSLINSVKRSIYLHNLDTELSPELIEQALLHKGDIPRLIDKLSAALKRGAIHIGVIGGSISCGGGILKKECRKPCLYHEYLTTWLEYAFPDVLIRVTNIALGSTGSEYFGFCLETHIKNLGDIDILLLEFAVNDHFSYRFWQPSYTERPAPLEMLLRKILLERSDPPFPILVNFGFGMTKEFFEGVCIDLKSASVKMDLHTQDGRWLDRALGELRIPPCEDIESAWNNLYAAYNLAVISWKTVINSLIQKKSPLSRNMIFGNDTAHPSIRAHKDMAVFIINYFKMIFRYITAVHDPSTSSSLNSLLSNHQALPKKPIHSSWFLHLSNLTCQSRSLHKYSKLFNTYKSSNFTPVEMRGFTNNVSFVKPLQHRCEVIRGIVATESGSFFTLSVSLVKPKDNSGYVAGFALLYRMCGSCVKNGIIAYWFGRHSDNSKRRQSTELPGAPWAGYQANTVKLLHGLQHSDSGHVYITVMLTSNLYSLYVHGFVSFWTSAEHLKAALVQDERVLTTGPVAGDNIGSNSL